MNKPPQPDGFRPIRPGGRGGKARAFAKGRQVDVRALEEISQLMEGRPLRRDLLIEHLHVVQDTYGHISAAHLAALAELMRLPQAEVYEVATFYHHFDVVKEGETAPPDITIRVCDSLSCELAGAQELMATLAKKYNGGREARVVRAPCMGRCDTAPTLEIGHNHVDHATPEKVAEAIREKHFHPVIPVYETFEEYRDDGGYRVGGWRQVCWKSA